MANKSFEDLILGKVMSKAITDEDIEQLAISLKPAIVAKLKKDLADQVKEMELFEWNDELNEIAEALEVRTLREVRIALGLPEPEKKGRK